MPPFIAAVLIGAGAYAGFRAARHLWERSLHGQPDTAKGATGGPAPDTTIGEKDLGTLEYDPATGVYRPQQRH